ncbi:UDP-N-acetylmuramoyl-tripeptide--D-alanyl-D-alanine ligase [Aliidiomarina iranensis]|uniref:UDP-N-acetylmuramoyl-tripeptide--D-alanyl-D-alanine ligase n=1 Tax=Aliidiomarina iranensis TaxID=1434071 RepID=A0A432W2R2_9GAMM|nr:UDP-N-acetylmuramoyl-tripeptide--D-alanyl-D-alanine ligase [Aliidiomarina iranensis]RUO23521.1 UDP-N-acetylmuramoyl-tripeptide--D-alanyl-D-alanine ligase [Aliidiomarina iranensis]
MIPVSLAWVAEKTQGQLQGGSGEALLPSSCVAKHVVTGNVVIDSRQVQPGDLFIALKGPNHDAHDYADGVAAAGAIAIICSRPLDCDVPQILVADTHAALGQLAAAVKAEVAPKSVAITGSSGKTTVKEMVAAILVQAPSVSGKVLATKGNFNNDIGVPLTLLALTDEHTYGVFELGANHRGEIAYTTDLVKPDVALINNIAPAHVEGFGDVCGVAKAKSEIFRGLSPEGIAITNADSDFHEHWQRDLADAQHLTFGLSAATADIAASDIQLDNDGCAQFQLHVRNTGAEKAAKPEATASVKLTLPGKHNVKNALAAVAICHALGVPLNEIITGFSAMVAVPGRMNVHTPRAGLRVIDDTYNANVGSAKAAIDVLASLPGKRIFVFGDMGELGTQARAYHEEVGAHAITAGIDGLFTLGVLSQSASEIFNGHGGQHFDSVESLTTALLEMIQQTPEITILVKGSRSSRMERIVESLLTEDVQIHSRGQAAC